LTVRDACDHGYLVTSVTDACATLSEERHVTSLANNGGHCRQRVTGEMVEELALSPERGKPGIIFGTGMPTHPSAHPPWPAAEGSDHKVWRRWRQVSWHVHGMLVYDLGHSLRGGSITRPRIGA
jgi:hypothetical protein